VLLAPLRVVWLARKHDGQRSAHFSDLLRLGDPRDPGTLRQQWILRHDPERCRIVAGEPATASELRERWRGAGGVDLSQTTGLAEFVARQAGLALERAERRVRGARYKVPRLVEQDILGRPAFVGGLTNLARETGHGEARVTRDAARYLREIAATHSPYVIDLVAHLIRMLYTRGYGEALHYDREKLREIQALALRHPVVFLPSHKSNLDHLVLQYMLHENELPPNHTAGGINMNFFPVGPLVRRSGVFFIRRSFKDNPVYKFVLHHYIDYLIDKRFSLEWYVEGGRSRSGKLLPPRFGLLAYVADAHRRGIADDVLLIPVSIAYDQIGDVQDYAAEQTGAKKERESFGWFVKFVRRLHRRYGNIHFSFGDPISLTKAMGAPDPGARPNPDEESLAKYKERLAQGLYRPGVLEIWVMEADGSNKRQVTELGAASFAPFFHPDGKRIIFSSNHPDPRGRNFDLYLVNDDGTGLERVTSEPSFDGFPMFSPDGSQLVFASNRGGKKRGETNLFVVDWVE